MEEILIIQTNIYPFNLFIVSMLIDPDFLKKIVNIARPMAASAAATTRINKANICPNKSSRVFENPTKFMFVAKSINSNRDKLLLRVIRDDSEFWLINPLVIE